MTYELLLDVALLGLIEGLTEFIPVSSTGHLILGRAVLGFEGPPGHVFEIVIQLGAILAVVVLYFSKLWHVAIGLPTRPEARRFAGLILLAFLPAVAIGVLSYDFIKAVLFSPYVVCVSLIAGGGLILYIERLSLPIRYRAVEEFTPGFALKLGFIQCLAMIPGVSRAGATILGGLLLGADRRSATEFSFLLAIPTMLGAATYDLYNNWRGLDADGGLVIALGFAVAFLAAFAVVRALIGFVSRHGFAPFAWYRIALGSLGLVLLLLA